MKRKLFIITLACCACILACNKKKADTVVVCKPDADLSNKNWYFKINWQYPGHAHSINDSDYFILNQDYTSGRISGKWSLCGSSFNWKVQNSTALSSAQLINFTGTYKNDSIQGYCIDTNGEIGLWYATNDRNSPVLNGDFEYGSSASNAFFWKVDGNKYYCYKDFHLDFNPNEVPFMPSSGSYYYRINVFADYGQKAPFVPHTAIYQENVDLSKVKFLVFDYSVVLFDRASKVEVLFAANNDTTVLWSTIPTQLTDVKDTAIAIPKLSTKGSLIITSNIGPGQSEGLTFAIDNIRTR